MPSVATSFQEAWPLAGGQVELEGESSPLYTWNENLGMERNCKSNFPFSLHGSLGIPTKWKSLQRAQ